MADNNDIEFRIRLATDQFNQAIRQVEDNYKKALNDIGASSENAGNRVKNSLGDAFKTLNVRPAQEVRAEIQKLGMAYEQLRASGASLEDLKRAEVALNEQTKRLNSELGNTGGVMGALKGAFSGVQGVISALGIGAIATKFLEANLASEKLQKSLTAITGSSGAAAKDMEFLKSTANKLGLDLEATAKGFTSLAAASKGTALEGNATKAIFTQMAGAMSQLGLNSGETERAFTALGQMMSKGTVSAEELKGQLGDVLPGAFQIAARSVGLTTQEFGKLMESGGVVADEFLPKFAAEVEKSFGGGSQQVDGMQAAINRVKNGWTEFATIIGDTGGNTAISGILTAINAVFMTLGTTIGFVIVGITGFAKSMGLLTAALVSMDFSGFKDGMEQIGNEMNKSIDRLGKLSNGALGIQQPMNAAGSAAAAAGNQVAQSGVQVAAAGVSWEKLNVIFTDLIKKAGEYTDQAKRVEEAQNRQAELSVKIAELSGIEKDALFEKSQAAQVAAKAAEAVATATETEAAVLLAKVEALKQEIEAEKNASPEKQKALDDAKKAYDAKNQEALAVRAAAEAKRVDADAARVESAAIADNSANVKLLKEALDLANAAKAAGATPTKTQAQLDREAAAAAFMYSDALKDQKAAIDANLAVKRSENTLAENNIRLMIELTRTKMESARAHGQENLAAMYGNDIKKLEIQLAVLKAQALRAEAEAQLAAVEAKKAELIASGQYEGYKKKEIEAAELAAKAKLVEADIAKALADRLKELGSTSGDAGGGLRSLSEEADRGAQSMERYAASADRATSSVERLQSTSRNSDPLRRGELRNGNWGAASNDGSTGPTLKEANPGLSDGGSVSAASMLAQRGIHLTPQELALFEQMYKQQFDEQMAKHAGDKFSFTGWQQYADFQRGLEDQAIRDTLGYVGDQVRSQGGQSGLRGRNMGLNGETVTVNVNIGGSARQINVASQQDAQALVGLFKDVERRTM